MKKERDGSLVVYKSVQSSFYFLTILDNMYPTKNKMIDSHKKTTLKVTKIQNIQNKKIKKSQRLK